MVSGIYKITNNLNNHFYIGQSKNINKRWKDHRKSAVIEKEHYTVLQRAFHKYGIDNFSFEIVEECPINELDEKEIFYISLLKPEYNMNLGGSGNKGYIVTDETKEVLRKLGKSQWESYDEVTKNKIIRQQLTGRRKGYLQTEETKKIISKKTKEYFIRNNGMSEKQKKKISESLKGKRRPNYAKYKPVVGTSDNEMKFYSDSIKHAAFILDIDKSSISHCLDGSRKHSAGFTWEYCSQETIHFWSRGEMITSRSAMHPTYEDEDIVHAIAKDKSYGVHDKGLIALARRSNTIKTIAAECIYSNDVVDIELGMNRHLSHKIDITRERGEVIAYYCLVELTNGGVQFCVKTKKDIENHRDKFSKAYDPKDPDNIWNKNFNPMALKTCVIDALKLCPISIEALDAVNKEEISETITPDDYTTDYEIKETTDEFVDGAIEPQKLEKVTVMPIESQPKPETIPENNSVNKNPYTESLAMSPEEEAKINAAFDAQSSGNNNQSELGFEIF